MPAPGKGPGSAKGTGGPGSLGGSGIGSPGGAAGGNGGNVGGMSPGLLDAKYPGAKNKKVKSRDLTLENAATLGAMVGSVIGGPVGTAINVGHSLATGVDPLDPFKGSGEVPSSGMGDYDKSEPSKDPGAKPLPKRKTTKPKNPLGAVGTILGGAGGTLTSGGL